MALFYCHECGKEISDRGKICPYCHYWIDRKFLEQNKQEMIEEGERQYRETYEYKNSIKEQEKLSKLPMCPICNSKQYVKRISNLSRFMSVSLFGFASSKMGKQYECVNCKHKWKISYAKGVAFKPIS